MLTRLSRKRRWLIYPSLIVWWLWSTMALCYAQSAAATASIAEVNHGSAMLMQGRGGSTAMHAEHGAADTMHDCCDDAAIPSCCGPADVLKTKSALDIDLQVYAVVIGWLTITSEPALPAFPTVDTVDSHAVLPRLHLLLSVFLD